MSLTAISFFLLTLSTVRALELELSFPESVGLDEEFTATISAATEEEHDVKIFVHNSEDEKISRSEYISEIFQDGWQDPWFYLSGAFPSKKEYNLRVTSSSGKRNICVRLRPSANKDSNFEQKCYNIEIIESDKETEDEEEEEREEENNEREEPEIEYNEEPERAIDEPVQNLSNLSISKVQEERLVLNPKLESGSEPVVSKSGIKRNVIIYSFTAFCVLLLVLIALRKL